MSVTLSFECVNVAVSYKDELLRFIFDSDYCCAPTWGGCAKHGSEYFVEVYFESSIVGNQYCAEDQRFVFNLRNRGKIDVAVLMALHMGFHSAHRRDIFAPIYWIPFCMARYRLKVGARWSRCLNPDSINGSGRLCDGVLCT